MNWLSACIALRLVGAVLAVLVWVKKSFEQLKIKKMVASPIWPRTYHTCHQKPNLSHETVPLKYPSKKCFPSDRGQFVFHLWQSIILKEGRMSNDLKILSLSYKAHFPQKEFFFS